VLLAGCGAEGCTEAIMLAHGFTSESGCGARRQPNSQWRDVQAVAVS
jgi:hypothetical protein